MRVIMYKNIKTVKSIWVNKADASIYIWSIGKSLLLEVSRVGVLQSCGTSFVCRWRWR